MTIHYLRQIISITGYNNDLTGAEFQYKINGQTKRLSCGLESLISELICISSVENKEQVLDGYKLSQWDAINIVIRHEYSNSLESDNNKLDIFQAIANITNPNT